MAEPKITVVIPVWNGERFIRRTIDSILAQDMPDFELLVIDDGSTDGTAMILEEYSKDPRIRIHAQANQGLVGTRNAGLRMASCEMLAFIDADDLAAPSRLSRQYEHLRSHPSVAVLGSHVQCIDEEGRPLRVLHYPTGPAEVAATLARHCAVAQPAVMIRRSAALAVGGYRPAFKYGAEDYDLWLRLSERHEVDNLPEILTYYRIHGASISHTRRADQLVAAFAAICSARRRRRGLPDPADGLTAPIREEDLARYELGPDEEVAFLRTRLEILRHRDASGDDYQEWLRRSWSLRAHIRRGRHVRHMLMPGAFALWGKRCRADGIRWIGKAFMREPFSAAWMSLRRLFAAVGLGR